MGNVDLTNHFEQIVKQYVDEHPYKMSILVEKTDDNDYKVLYANNLAKDYFTNGIHKLSSSFFGEFWSKINRKMRILNIKSNYTCEIYFKKENRNELFDLELQHHKDGHDNEFVFIGLRDRKDLSTDGRCGLSFNINMHLLLIIT